MGRVSSSDYLEPRETVLIMIVAAKNRIQSNAQFHNQKLKLSNYEREIRAAWF